MTVLALDRMLECDACLEPASGTRCEACGEPVDADACGGPSSAPEGPYRAPPRHLRTKLLPVELATPPADSGALLVAWREAKAELGEPHAEEVELRATWVASVLASAYAARGEAARERAILETAYSRLTLPIYRATVAARLSRQASGKGAFGRAGTWLEAAGPRTGIAEVDGDVDVARALLAYVLGDDEQVLSIVGPSPGSALIAGCARVLAAVLRACVLERRGDPAGALRLRRMAVQEYGAIRVARAASRLGVARVTRPRSVERARAAAAVVAALGTLAAALAWALSA